MLEHLASKRRLISSAHREAFAFAPTPTIQDAINDGQACGSCGKLFFGKTALVIPCTAHDSLTERASKKSATGKKVPNALVKKAAAKPEKVDTAETSQDSSKPKCNMKFCNSLCRDRCEWSLCLFDRSAG